MSDEESDNNLSIENDNRITNTQENLNNSSENSYQVSPEVLKHNDSESDENEATELKRNENYVIDNEVPNAKNANYSEAIDSDEEPVESRQKVINDEFDGFKQVEGEHSEKVMNDIFGDSDEEEDFEGFDEEEVKNNESAAKPMEEEIVDNNDDNQSVAPPPSISLPVQGERNILQCFEDILETQKKERRANRPKRRTDVEFINDLDDKIMDLMNKMRLAALEDEELYLLGQPGVKKMILLPEVKDLLRRSDINEVLIESKFLNIMAAWLKALPNQVLPPLDIRKTMLTALANFPPLSNDILRESKIGKAVMFLLQHPKEIPEHKRMAKSIINEWSRRVFNLSSNYKGMTREERLERDRAITSKRQLVDKDATVSKKERKKEESSKQPTRPGEEGWIPRATVPAPSYKDYVIRPSWRYKESVRKRSAPNGEDEDYNEPEEDDEEEEEDMMNRLRPMLQKRLKSGQKNTNLGASKSAALEKKIKDAVKKTRSVQRASNVSVQGRGMHL